VAITAGGNWLIAEIDDWQCLKQECSSLPNIEVLCSADTGEWRCSDERILKHQASAARHAADETIIITIIMIIIMSLLQLQTDRCKNNQQ